MYVGFVCTNVRMLYVYQCVYALRLLMRVYICIMYLPANVVLDESVFVCVYVCVHSYICVFVYVRVYARMRFYIYSEYVRNRYPRISLHWPRSNNVETSVKTFVPALTWS